MNRPREEQEDARLSDEVIGNLIALQGLDADIAAAADRRKRKPRDLESRKRELESQRQSAQAAKDTVTAAQKRIDSKSVESDSLQQDIAKLEGQLFGLKTTAEFDAMKLQIKQRKEQNDKLQDEVLELMMAMDDIKARHAEEEDKLRQERGLYESAEGQVNDDIARIDARVGELEEKRAAILAALPADIAALYEDVRDRRGSAVSAIEEEICRGCYTQVTMQTLNAVMGRRLIQCPHCDRILYVER